jgi:hypothetical protein
MWFFTGMLFAIFIITLYLCSRKFKIAIKWYESVVAILSLPIIFFGLQNYMAARAEHWSSGTPLTFIMIFIVPGVTLLALVLFLVFWRYFRRGAR